MTDLEALSTVADVEMPSIDPAVFELGHEASLAHLLELADDSWIVRSLFGYSILTHADSTAILRDKRWHNAAGQVARLRGVTDPDMLPDPDRPSILAAEGDKHTRLRRIVGKAFSPRSADRLRPAMRQVMNDLVDPVAASGRAEIVADITEPYPIPIICELLGAPKEDWQLFSRWAEDILSIFDGSALDRLDQIKAARNELNAYTVQMIAQRRSDPREDLLTDLIAAEEDGEKLDTEELVMMVNAVIIAGTDTTRNQLGCALALFADHPDQWKMLADDPSLAPQAVEECMRHFGAVRGLGRFASEDIVYRDILFPAGTFVFPSSAASNRDDSVFSDATTFDITKQPSTSPHLTLGSGIHYCLGAWLARAELQEALPLLARRMPDLAVDGDIDWKPAGTAIFGPKRFPVTFSPT
jgi:cytochrome P450